LPLALNEIQRSKAVRLRSSGVDVNATITALPSELYLIAPPPENLCYKLFEFSAVNAEQQAWIGNKIGNQAVDAAHHSQRATGVFSQEADRGVLRSLEQEGTDVGDGITSWMSKIQ
jgi:hypothetical protein